MEILRKYKNSNAYTAVNVGLVVGGAYVNTQFMRHSITQGMHLVDQTENNFQDSYDALKVILQKGIPYQQDDIAFVSQSMLQSRPILEPHQPQWNNLTQLLDSLKEYAGTQYAQQDQAGIAAALSTASEEIDQIKQSEKYSFIAAENLLFATSATVLSAILTGAILYRRALFRNRKSVPMQPATQI